MLKRNKTISQASQPAKKRKGQSTVEYVLLVAAILGALVFFLRPGGDFGKAFCAALNEGTDGMVNMANRLKGSHI